MKTKNSKAGWMLALAVATLAAGCATPPAPLYQWGRYQAEVYDYFKGGSREKQIAELEQDLEKMQAKGSVVPPGVHAHLGMLYAEAGNDSKAIEQLQAEKAKYAESAAYIDFLLKKYQKE